MSGTDLLIKIIYQYKSILLPRLLWLVFGDLVVMCCFLVEYIHKTLSCHFPDVF